MIVAAADVHPLLNIKDVYLLEHGPSMFLLYILGGGSMVLAGFLSSHQLVYWAFMKHLLHVWCCVPEESPAASLLPSESATQTLVKTSEDGDAEEFYWSL